MTTTAKITTASIRIDVDALKPLLDGFYAMLATEQFPVTDLDLSEGMVYVDASSDPDYYSVLMAANQACRNLGIDPDGVIYWAEIEA